MDSKCAVFTFHHLSSFYFKWERNIVLCNYKQMSVFYNTWKKKKEKEMKEEREINTGWREMWTQWIIDDLPW